MTRRDGVKKQKKISRTLFWQNPCCQRNYWPHSILLENLVRKKTTTKLCWRIALARRLIDLPRVKVENCVISVGSAQASNFPVGHQVWTRDIDQKMTEPGFWGSAFWFILKFGFQAHFAIWLPYLGEPNFVFANQTQKQRMHKANFNFALWSGCRREGVWFPF